MENFKAMGNMKRLETLCIAGAVAVLAVSCGKEGLSEKTVHQKLSSRQLNFR